MFALFQQLKRLTTKELCKHPEYYETMACDGVCMSCGKNLGFVGNLDRSKEVASNDPIRWNQPPSLEKLPHG